jgi:hypothetical protein
MTSEGAPVFILIPEANVSPELTIAAASTGCRVTGHKKTGHSSISRFFETPYVCSRKFKNDFEQNIPLSKPQI